MHQSIVIVMMLVCHCLQELCANKLSCLQSLTALIDIDKQVS